MISLENKKMTLLHYAANFNNIFIIEVDIIVF